MSEKESKKLVHDIKKAEVMAHAENYDRTEAEFARAAANIVRDSWQNEEHVNHIDRQLKSAKEVDRNSSRNLNWEEKKNLRGAEGALEAWEDSLDHNASVLDSKYATEFVTHTALRILDSKTRRHERAANKAGRIASRDYDRRQKYDKAA